MSILKVARMGHPVLRARAKPLDPADIKKAMWAEVSPDGKHLYFEDACGTHDTVLFLDSERQPASQDLAVWMASALFSFQPFASVACR